MPKSKEFLSSDDSDSDREATKPKKMKIDDSLKKEQKKSKDLGKSKSSSSEAEKGPNGELMFQLARMRYATVSQFRGKVLVSIREYYDKDGNMLPGKKGISMTLEQWTALKDHIEDIDKAVKDM